MKNAAKKSIIPTNNNKSILSSSRLENKNNKKNNNITKTDVNYSIFNFYLIAKINLNINENDILNQCNEILSKKNSKSTPNDNNRYVINTNEQNESEKASVINTNNSYKLSSEKNNKEANIKKIDNSNIFRKSLHSQNSQDFSNNNPSSVGSKNLKDETEILFNKINLKLKETNLNTRQNKKKSSDLSNFASPKLQKNPNLKQSLNFLNKNITKNIPKSIKAKDNILTPKIILDEGLSNKSKLNLLSPSNKINNVNEIPQNSISKLIINKKEVSIKLDKSNEKNDVKSPESL